MGDTLGTARKKKKKKRQGATEKDKGRGKGELSTYEIGVPHANYVLYTKFSHEETVHPPETELYKLDALLLKMFGEGRVDPGSEVA